MVRVILAVAGFVAVALAQQSTYTGPLFDEDTAPYFGSSGLVFPTSADGTPAFPSAPTITPSASSSTIPTPISGSISSTISSAVSSSMLSSIPSPILSSTLSMAVPHNSTISSSATTLSASTISSPATTLSSSSRSSTSDSVSRTSSSTTEDATTSRLTPSSTSIGAAATNFPEALGIMVGGLVAGLAML
ncbi:hypothetical protein COCMIDRAFT_97378 [Bipolaris oryzae ATCC 44560]|uniref:REJ domain-containing protein n=1 Tax=Bipolaris oryzae ATCC 44560 TaxID=930090 RepID=W6ZMD9_COCMI|nr:uncharacterized protein COCMIDRAFT_97378 [Bipolaris oryzae ATCC 44560]EUC44756.1 hypothetical protein COCMIDRAFT_97378 [Bipolaris oryzae ATCC 44560]